MATLSTDQTGGFKPFSGVDDHHERWSKRERSETMENVVCDVDDHHVISRKGGQRTFRARC